MCRCGSVLETIVPSVVLCIACSLSPPSSSPCAGTVKHANLCAVAIVQPNWLLLHCTRCLSASCAVQLSHVSAVLTCIKALHAMTRVTGFTKVSRVSACTASANMLSCTCKKRVCDTCGMCRRCVCSCTHEFPGQLSLQPRGVVTRLQMNPTKRRRIAHAPVHQFDEVDASLGGCRFATMSRSRLSVWSMLTSLKIEAKVKNIVPQLSEISGPLESIPDKTIDTILKILDDVQMQFLPTLFADEEKAGLFLDYCGTRMNR